MEERHRIDAWLKHVCLLKQRKMGIGRNPKTGVEVKIPPGNTIRFKPGKELRNLL